MGGVLCGEAVGLFSGKGFSVRNSKNGFVAEGMLLPGGVAKKMGTSRSKRLLI